MGGYIPIIGFAVLFMGMIYFMMIRPIRQREKIHDAMVDTLEKGDIVITAGGIYGKVDNIYEDSVILKVESGTTVRVTKGGIVKRANEPEGF